MTTKTKWEEHLERCREVVKQSRAIAKHLEEVLTSIGLKKGRGGSPYNRHVPGDYIMAVDSDNPKVLVNLSDRSNVAQVIETLEEQFTIQRQSGTYFEITWRGAKVSV